MQLSKVSNPVFPSIQDIALYTMCDSLAVHKDLYGSSLDGQRSIADFFKLLDHLIQAVPDNGYKLQKLDDTLTPLTNPPVERSPPGNIAAGNYLILSSVEGGEITFKPFFDLQPIGTDSPSKPAVKRVKLDGVGSTASERSSRDPSDDSESFKMRLLYRDRGCAVCLAVGIQAIYKYRDDSDFYEAGHIINSADHDLVVSRYLCNSWTKKDLRRINALENGMLFCLQHHREYEKFRFAILPETHEIFSFHPATAALHGVEVKAPWDGSNILFPPPLPAFLEIHYFLSIAKAMKGGGGDYELDGDGDDYQELCEPEEENMT